MPKISHYTTKSDSRKIRVRSKIFGTAERPRLTVYRANKYSYIQIIDDVKEVTLLTMSDMKIRKAVKKTDKLTKTESAIKATEELLVKMKKAKITAVVFDRGQYKYHGRVKAIAEALRNGGIKV
ncbi:MAG: 50S ribosomal protein L18 [Candidatus Pacebacteria bacterium CG_4_10_14_3_um_filter_34_15]|nr:50S ribosomal protein L18 [Candidatus Pacearchaeota archaeon]NCQ65262.1 50S ribosomal protein L18 [Candidatus Paceibacterota bacterium]OIO45011.1 MAG: 50S ribosomal protein L18 [Candidatus Pacebacteria bacterium CG1_02_43_31]PIQ81041.1 MAG: 50S ribosomal protein L18 [Candidatus Pacebacteria bacterium CG11_big_fil_rev_8_21_14_0_20_34_55]PIX81858.1 MAG: 50S ribosomal protein L18 [Candidatus Pacebacteria bacterium CG_4_10_14_3_um_filter_34_15]PJC44073.1 MAG: 50S ribosomal protein L18 [Candidat